MYYAKYHIIQIKLGKSNYSFIFRKNEYVSQIEVIF